MEFNIVVELHQGLAQLKEHGVVLVGYLSEARIFSDILGLCFSEFYS